MSEDLTARITLDSRQFSLGVGEIVSKLSTLETATAKMGASLESNLGRSLGQVNQQLQGLSLESVVRKLESSAQALQGAFQGIVAPATSFQSAMANVNTIAKLSDSELASLSNQLRTLSTTIGIGIPPTEAAAAQYEILGAGFTNAADATKVLSAAAVSSQGGLTTIQQSADLLTSALNAYGLSADQAGRVSDILFTSVDKGKHNFQDLANGLGQVVPAAAANGVSLEELSSAVAALTANAVRPAVAMTGLNAAIVQLSAPTEQARKAAAALGLDLDDAGFRGLTLVQKLQLLSRAAGENKSALRQILGDTNALGVAYTLTGNGAKTYAEALAAATGPSNAASEAARRNGATLEASQKKFAAATEALKIALADGVLPLLTKAADAGTSFVKFLDGYSAGTKAAAGITLGLAAVIGTLGTALLGAVIAARTVAVSLGVQVPAASKLASGAMETVAVRATAAKTAMTGFLTSAAAGPAIVAGLGAGLIILANEFAKVNLEAAKAETALTSLGGGTKKQGGKRGDISAGGLLSTSPEELKKQGVTDKDVVDQIARLRESKEGLLTDGLGQGVIRGLDDRIAKLEELRQVLARGKKDEPLVPGAKVDPVEEALKRRKKVEDPKVVEERRKQGLFEIENSKLSGEERIKALEAFLAKEKLVGDERRAIEHKIFQEREKLQSDAASKAKELAEDQKADALQAIDLSKASHQSKIQQLGELAKKYKDDADLRRRINGEIAKEEEAIAKEAADRKKKRDEEAKWQAEDAKDRSDEERGARQEAIGLRNDALGGELEKAKDKGKTAEVGALLQERQRLAEETIRLQLAEQLAQTQSAEARVQLERNAEERIRQEKQKTADEFKAFTDKQIEDQKRLDEAKKPKGPSTEFTGQLLSVEDLAKQSEGRFGSTAVNDDFAARQAATAASRQKKLATNLTNLGAGVPGLTPAAVAAKVGPATSSPITAKLEPLEVEITIKYPDGSTETRRTTLSTVGAPASGPGSIPSNPRGRA